MTPELREQTAQLRKAVREAVSERELHPATVLRYLSEAPMDWIDSMLRLLLTEMAYRCRWNDPEQIYRAVEVVWESGLMEMPWANDATPTEAGKAWKLASGRWRVREAIDART